MLGAAGANIRGRTRALPRNVVLPVSTSSTNYPTKSCVLTTYNTAAAITMSTILSEKAKGKQRAAPPLAPEQLVTEQPPDSPPSKDLTIRFTEGIPDLIVQVAEKDTVKDVKDKVCRVAMLHSHELTTSYRFALSGQSSRIDASGLSMQDSY